MIFGINAIFHGGKVNQQSTPLTLRYKQGHDGFQRRRSITISILRQDGYRISSSHSANHPSTIQLRTERTSHPSTHSFIDTTNGIQVIKVCSAIDKALRQQCQTSQYFIYPKRLSVRPPSVIVTPFQY